MYRMLPLLVAASVLPLLVACQSSQDRNPLEGTWEMITSRVTSPEDTVELDINQIKILTKTHFAFGRQNPEGAYAGGGPYLYEDGTYTEIITYHSNSDLLGDTIRFDARIENDTLWYHSGSLGNNLYLEEVWRRIGE